MKPSYWLFLFTLLPFFAVGQTLQQQDAQQILAEIVTHLHCEQGAVVVTDMDNHIIASADGRATKHGLKPCKKRFMEAAAERLNRFTYADCHKDYAGLKEQDFVAKAQTDFGPRKGVWWGHMTVYYPAEQPQYRIFVIMEKDVRKDYIYYATALCAPVVMRIVQRLN